MVMGWAFEWSLKLLRMALFLNLRRSFQEIHSGASLACPLPDFAFQGQDLPLKDQSIKPFLSGEKEKVSIKIRVMLEKDMGLRSSRK